MEPLVPGTPIGIPPSEFLPKKVQEEIEKAKQETMKNWLHKANEKFREYQELFSESGLKVAISTGDIDSGSEWLANYDVLVLTVEKLDSLVRHFCSWLPFVSVIVIDEIHLLNDAGRGPTLEVLITILRELVKEAQIIALSATIGNPERLAEWLGAELVVDDWRPVKLYRGVYLDGEIEFLK